MATFSQEMQLSVTNKPLNAVLGMLGIEISFDNKALSAYNISVSKTFRNPEEALYYLLNNKPFKVEKINHVYIIIPSDKQIIEKMYTPNYPDIINKLFSPEPFRTAKQENL